MHPEREEELLDVIRGLCGALDTVPLPSHLEEPRDFYARLYDWIKVVRTPALLLGKDLLSED